MMHDPGDPDTLGNAHGRMPWAEHLGDYGITNFVLQVGWVRDWKLLQPHQCP